MRSLEVFLVSKTIWLLWQPILGKEDHWGDKLDFFSFWGLVLECDADIVGL